MTAFALTEPQRAFADQVRAIAAEQLRPIAEAGAPGHVNRELIKAMGQLGLLPRLFPGQGGTGGPGGSSSLSDTSATDLCLLREALATQSTEAETALALQGLGAYPILQSGQEDVVRRWLPAVAVRRRRGGVRAHRARGRLGCRRARAAGRAGWRRVAADRTEDLDLQRPRGRRLHRLRPDHTRCGRPGRERVRGACRPPGPTRRAPGHDQPAPDRQPDLRRRPGGPDRAPRRAGPRLPGRDEHAGPVPAQRGRVRGRHGPGRPRRGRAARRDPDRVRRAAQGPAGRLAPAGRDGDPDRGGAAAGLRGGGGLRRGQ